MLNFFKRSGKPTVGDIVDRLFILRTIIVYAYSIPPVDILEKTLETASDEEKSDFEKSYQSIRERVSSSLKDNKLWGKVSPYELSIVNTHALSFTERQRVDMSWRIESAMCLMWSLGLIKKIPPFDEEQSIDLLKTIPADDIGSFRKNAKLRSTTEIEVFRSLAETWHWRSRTRQLDEEKAVIKLPEGVKSLDDVVRMTAKQISHDGDTSIPIQDEDYSAFGKAYRDLNMEQWQKVRSISVERHFALNWLCGHAPKNRWDDTPTDT